MILLSWNVRGIGAARKRGMISGFLAQFKASIIILQETKCQEMTDTIAKELWSCPSIKWEVVDAIGHSGGILLAWDSTFFDSINVIKGQYSLGIQFRDLSYGKLWCVGGVYGPTRYRDRNAFWEELNTLKQNWNLPWIFAGDFNAIRYCQEKKPPAVRISASM
ncbi:uncharacterized protein [Aristolochia californica]|uniref:uncharacterized protein n=1 Tax=Aristolochia californica TaxID=171875 RepID=UPI0035DF760F